MVEVVVDPVVKSKYKVYRPRLLVKPRSNHKRDVSRKDLELYVILKLMVIV